MIQLELARPFSGALLGLLSTCACLGGASAQQLTRNTTDVPTTATGYTENVDFGDVDGDGDWDAAFADGGDFGNQQNRIWINHGHLQGGAVGVFVDETATRFPAILDASRDVEFADFDGDGDLDLHSSNESTLSNQPCRFWINQGGLQGATIGFYVDDTAARWVGLGMPGSSMPPSLVLAGGGFADFSGDSDFGDIDSDGDLDLVHTSHGIAFGANIPTRLFLNDGAGFFSEFNPSGVQLGGMNIPEGTPGLWCEGVQNSGTSNTTGAQCDIATGALNDDFGDIDGDLDLDFILGSITDRPRMYANRSTENGGPLSFRDVTGSTFVPSLNNINGRYEEEFGDLDSDGDLDLLGVNYHTTPGNYSDTVYQNNGAGAFGNPADLASSQSDDEDGDMLDYDNDGDLDLFLINFSGQERMYTNSGAGTFSLGVGIIPPDGSQSRDADCVDVDEDGDPDIFVANDANQAEWYLQNGTSANDVFAPRVLRLEQALDRAPGVTPTVVRVQVYDNAPYYVTWYAHVDLEVRVNGGSAQTFPMKSSMGQIFRGEIDGSLVGSITYRAIATDEYGNTGIGQTRTYIAGLPVGTPYCFGDGSGTTCPCGNASAPGSQAGCLNSVGVAGKLVATGTANVSADSVILRANGLPNSSGLYYQGTLPSAGGSGAVFGDGLRCASGSVLRLATKVAASNASSYPEPGDAPISVRGLIPVAGGTRTYQLWYRNAAAFCQVETFNLTNGVSIAWAP